MKEVSRKLTLEQISKDVHVLTGAFKDHAREDAQFQAESMHVHKSMQESMEKILNKLDPKHEDYINKGIEERITVMESKLDQVWGLFQGLSFSGKAIKYTAGVVVALAAIITSLFALIRFVK